MPVGINTNIESLAAVRYLSKTSGMIQQSMQRLSSGKRINTAADDAAGLAVISNLNRQVQGTEQAIRNSLEGVSFIQVMDSALDELTNVYQRARQLAVYSSNGSLSAADRTALDVEYKQLVGAGGEAERIVTSTSFNGNSLIDSAVAFTFQVGWQDSDTIDITAQNMSRATIYTGGADISTQVAAQSELAPAVIDASINSIVAYRAELGAFQNRFESTISNLENLSEKTQVARGRIEDADFAKETTELARYQVLQQAGMGMLARANEQSSLILQLLR